MNKLVGSTSYLHRMLNPSLYCLAVARVGCLGICFFLLISTPSFAIDTWHPIQEHSLGVVEGSVLDFTALRPPGPAGANGWIGVGSNGRFQMAGDSKPQRFLCASLVPSDPNGGLPNKPDADLWVEQLVRTGYNCARLHYIDAILMSGRTSDFDYDPVGMDRLQYLMARLKTAGIYWILDGMTSANGAYGNVQPHRWVNRFNLTERLYYDPLALDHWKRLVTSLWGMKNPYTGLYPLQDPAMLGMILFNEGGLTSIATGKRAYPKELSARFGLWLAKRYSSDVALVKAWGVEATSRDHVGQPVDVPVSIRGKGARARDFAEFIADQEISLYNSMDEFVRRRGFKGLTTAYNHFGFYHEDVARSAAKWIDMHAYQSLPSNLAKPGSTLAQSSIFDNVGRYGRELTNARQFGKPFTVTEYGQPFWNQWRHESTGWLPALAAFQGWDAICQFAELPVLLEYGRVGAASRRQAMYPYGIGGDPITRAGERLAALLFLRGDVSPSRVRVNLDFDADYLFSDGNAWEQVPEPLSRLAFIAGTGLAIGAQAATSQDGRDIHFALNVQSSGLLAKVKNLALDRGVMFDKNPVARMKSEGLLAASNQSNMSAGVFETDTGQIVFNVPDKRLTINTDRTVVFTLRAGSDMAGVVGLTGLSSPATVAVSAIDNKKISQSKRLLVFVLTDAINTAMEFTDSDRVTLKTLGSFPPQLRAVTGKLAIKHESANRLKVFAVDQTGRRVAQVASKSDDGNLRFAIDNIPANTGPVVYFEIAEQ